MQINRTNSQTNFTSIYRIKNTTAEKANEIRDMILPVCEKVLGVPTYSFIGNSPFDSALITTIQKVFEKDGYSYTWAHQNAQNHGLKIPDLNNINYWIFTGYDDLQFLQRFMKSTNRPNIFKQILNKFAQLNEIEFLPDHLKCIYSVVRENDGYIEKFQKMVTKREIKDIKDYFELQKGLINDKTNR